jgi:hypothetical protein
VAFRVIHGHTSWTEVHDIAQGCRADPRPVTAFYVGDYDPSGMHMSEVDLPNRLAEMGVEVTIRRLAIHAEDAKRRQLPSFSAHTKKFSARTKEENTPQKQKGDPRYAWFLREYGEPCWELDALSPAVLRNVVEAAIFGCIDQDAWQRCAVTERAEQRSLRHVLGNWRSAISGLATK